MCKFRKKTYIESFANNKEYVLLISLLQVMLIYIFIDKLKIYVLIFIVNV